jgi:hypothetical protein
MVFLCDFKNFKNIPKKRKMFEFSVRSWHGEKYDHVKCTAPTLSLCTRTPIYTVCTFTASQDPALQKTAVLNNKCRFQSISTELSLKMKQQLCQT